MLLNESFLDSSIKRESALSKAKLTGYVPRGKRSARINIALQVDMASNSQPSSRSILIPKGTGFVGANATSDQRIFYTIEDLFIKNISIIDGSIVRYTSDSFTIYEGSFSEWKFTVDNSLLDQRFIIQSKNIDIDTIKIIVLPAGQSSGDEYLLSGSLFDINESSKVFYLSTNESGYYEIFFGNNVFGKTPENNSTIIVNYMNTNGISGNGARRFRFNAPSGIPEEFSAPVWGDVELVIAEGDISNGGADEETLESIKFNIPHHFKRQNRIVTETDYRAVLLSKFPSIESINVWGGEKNYYKDYGKVHISIKPFFADKLTTSAKTEIKNDLINKYCIVGMEPVIEDPEFIDVSMTVYAKINPTKTHRSLGIIEKEISDKISEYNQTTLNVFDNSLSDVSLLQLIMKDTAIKSCYTKKVLFKTYTLLYSSGVENVVLIGNPLEPGITSDYFTYGTDQCYYKDDTNGKLYIYKKINQTKLLTKDFGYVEYDAGIIHFMFPDFAHMTENDSGNSGLITFTAIPVNPDIDTFANNILRISQIRVHLTLSN